jgi:alpha-L-rhamnosidase
MNSFNHYAYGAIGDWLYRVMAGIDVDEALPGYKRVLIRPRPGGGFTRVKAAHESPYGRVSSAWTLEGGRFALEVEVPPNTTARVRLPATRLHAVTESGRPLAAGDGIAAFRQDGDAVVVDVGSGRYAFASEMAP